MTIDKSKYQRGDIGNNLLTNLAADTTSTLANTVSILSDTTDIISDLGDAQNVPQFGGNIYYVSTGGDDTKTGLSPNESLATIGAAIALLSVGDAINVMAGTYTELALDLDVNACEIWFEIGSVLDPASGVALTVSANYCKVLGQCLVTPSAAVGVLVSGTNGYFSDIFVQSGTSGWQVTGVGNEFRHCRSVSASSIGFDIQAGQTRFIDCNTGGAGGATMGFKISNSADKGLLDKCTSVSHGSAGFHIDTGSSDWTLFHCSSGSGDGKWVDTDNTNVWSDFSYDNHLYKTITLTATGGVGAAGTNYNLFKITGAVKVFNIYGHVTTITPATASTINLELYSSNAHPDITDSAGAPDLTTRVVGTIISRQSVAADPLELEEPDNTPVILENASYRSPSVPVTLIKDDAADTYIQLVMTAAMASGAIHWHIDWEPVTEAGFVEPA